MGFTWQRGKILVIVEGTFALLFLMGLGAVRLFVPNLQGILSPLVGAGVVISLSYYARLLGISMRTATWGILAIELATALTAFLLGKPSQRSCRSMGLPPMALGAGALLLEGRGSLFLSALSLSTLFSVYPPLIPYVLVPLLLYGTLRV